MHLIIKQNDLDVAKEGASFISKHLNEDPNLAISFATGRTPIDLYSELVRVFLNKEIDFKSVKAFHLDEFCDLGLTEQSSFKNYLNKNLFSKVNFKAENLNFIESGQTDLDQVCYQYEKLIADSGGIDLQILGIGENGHIGFNEPGSSFSSRTRVVEISEQSRINNAWAFNGLDQVPHRAITVGIKTITESKKILLLATGKNKASIIKKALKGEISPLVPASVLQNHPDLTVFLDDEAASLLG